MCDSKNVTGGRWRVTGVLVTLSLALAVGCSKAGSPEAGKENVRTASAVAGLENTVRFKIPVSMSQPSIGKSDAAVTVVEWGAFRGEPARAAAKALDDLRKKYGDALRVVHRQLPDPSNEESLRVNYFARGAFDVANKFWEVRARLLETPDNVPLTEDALKGIAAEFGIDWAAIDSGLKQDHFSRYVTVDVRFAGIFGVNETPTFFVNGRRLPDVTTAQLEPSLDALIALEQTNAKDWLARGTEPASLYDAIIEDARWSFGDDPVARRAKAAEAAQSPGAAPGNGPSARDLPKGQ